MLESVKEDFDKKSSVLKNIPAFTHLTKNALVKLTFCMSEHTIGKDTSLFKEGEHIKGLYLIKEGNFEITRKFKKDLKEKYKGHALPVQIRRNIKCFVASNNEALGLEHILGYSDTHDFGSVGISSSATYYFLDKEVRLNINDNLASRRLAEE